MNQITLSDFSETIQTLLSQAPKTGENLVITKDGVPLAMIQPILKNKRSAFGAMESRTKIIGDIVEPTSNL
jgi:antitoxin (DNA-binding transcriptional repressor) of toxin-antitoxin stability system